MKNSNINGLNGDDFEVVGELGAGSFGVVKLVKKYSDQVKYAIKEVLLSRLTLKEKQSALNQVRLLASINIPNVIAYKGAYFDRNRLALCLVMQYADGGDLQHRISQRSQLYGVGFDECEVWKILYELLCGLKTLHAHKIIHRDIKAANVFFVEGVAKLGDLNVSKVAEKGMCETRAGTPYYTSPEIWNGSIYGNKCDVWSTGCLTYQMCNLTTPFRANDFPSLFRKITSGSYPPLHPNYSQQLKSIIAECLNIDPQKRPTANQLLQVFPMHKMETVKHQQEGKVKLITPIKYPKMLNLLNSRLPKAQFESNSKKTAVFISRKLIKFNQQSEETQMRRFKTQKQIRLKDNDEVLPKVLQNVALSKKNMKLPPIQNPKDKQQDHRVLEFTNKIKKKIYPNKNVNKCKSQKHVSIDEKQNSNMKEKTN